MNAKGDGLCEADAVVSVIRTRNTSFKTRREVMSQANVFSRWNVLLIALAAGLAAAPASALITSKGQSGSNHDRAHVAPHKSTGAGVPVGVIEVGGGVDTTKTTIDDDGRLAKNLNFIGVATPVAAEPANVGGTTSAHATQVTDIVGSSHNTYTGVAPGARMYVGAIQTNAEVFGATVWYNDTNSVGIFNYSLGSSAFGFQSVRNHTETQFTFNNAGDSTNITTNPFNFNIANFQSIDQIDYRIILNDVDNGPGEFDNGNFQLNIGGVVISPFNSTIATDGVAIRFTGSLNLTPAQSQTLTTTLTNNAGNVHIQLQRIAAAAANDVTPTNDAAGFNQRARLILRQFNDDGNSQLAKALDWHSTATDSLMVVAAGNDGNNSGQIESPGDLWNGISVGALNTSFTKRVGFSSYLQAVGDGKPDVVAPGQTIVTEGYAGVDGTSFASPHVTGIAALLEAGTNQTGGLVLGLGGTRHLATKAIILNSARKRFTVAPENSVNLDIRDNDNTNGQAADADYLNGGLLRDGDYNTAPKTPSWTPSEWDYDATDNFFVTIDPLDDELGTGIADAERALIQLDGGKQTPGNVSRIGWDTNAVAPGNFTEYVLNLGVDKGDFITITLDWDRLIARTDDGDGKVDYADTFDVGTVPDLDLLLMYDGEVFAQSSSFTNNVEHLHVPFMEDGDAGDYTIRVFSDALYNSSTTTYGLAWWTTPEPGSLALVGLGVVVLLRRRP